MNPKISEEIGFKFRTNEIPISPHKGALSCFFNHSFYTTIYDIQSITVKQQPHNNVPVLNILMHLYLLITTPKHTTVDHVTVVVHYMIRQHP